MADGAGAKNCVVCGCDCAAIPRAKDRRGRYFCRPCYDHAVAQAKARAAGGAAASGPNRAQSPAAASAAKPLRPAARPMVAAAVRAAPAGDDPLAALLMEEQRGVAVETAHPCGSCGAPLAPGKAVCPACGFNARTREKPAPAVRAAKAAEAGKSARSGGAGILSNPTYVGLGQIGIVLLLFGVAKAGSGLEMLFVIPVGLFGLGVSIWVLITAFSESVGTGLLCLCLWPYTLYFVFAKCGNPNLRWSCGAVILGNILAGITSATAATRAIG